MKMHIRLGRHPGPSAAAAQTGRSGQGRRGRESRDEAEGKAGLKGAEQVFVTAGRGGGGNR